VEDDDFSPSAVFCYSVDAILHYAVGETLRVVKSEQGGNRRLLVMQHHEDGLDEVLLMHNPKGGRPQRIGTIAPSKQLDPTSVDISEIREASTIRYHLGYCSCSRRIVVGYERARVFVTLLEKHGIQPVRVRFREHVLDWLTRSLAR
jgi:hypothetical protein